MRSSRVRTKIRLKVRRVARYLWRATRSFAPFGILFFAAGLSFYLGIRLRRQQIPPVPLESGKLQVVTLNVQQGEASYVRTPDGCFIVIGAGPSGQGARVVAALRSAGAQHIDLLCIPYDDGESMGGAIEIMDAFPIGHVVEPAGPVVNRIQDRFRTACVQRHIPDHEVHSGGIIHIGNSVRIDVDAPGTSAVDASTSVGGNSLVLRLRYGKTAFLWAGGLDRAGETALLSRTPKLAANWLRVAHFGAADTTSSEFLSLVSPDFAVISVGPNTDDLPAFATLSRLQAAGVAIYRTDTAPDSLTFVSDGVDVTGPKLQ